jgi:hypothetical protein
VRPARSSERSTDFSRDVDREMGPVDEKIYEGTQAVEGVGREVLGINDAERSKDAFARGDIFGGLFYGALASPFGRWGKPLKEGVEEGAEQLAKRTAVAHERRGEAVGGFLREAALPRVLRGAQADRRAQPELAPAAAGTLKRYH